VVRTPRGSRATRGFSITSVGLVRFETRDLIPGPDTWTWHLDLIPETYVW